MAATNAAGTTTVRYGKTRANVLALEAVLADGSVIRTGTRARKTSAGYDLTGLLVGSEGTLAVITEVTVRLHPIAEHAVALRISFPDIEAVCRTAATIVGAGAGVTRLELLDAWVVSAINAYSGTSFPEGPCLFVEATGSREVVEADLELAEEIARGEGATEIVVERDADARARLWKARHDMAHAATAKVPGTKERATDVCVPLTELAGAVRFARSEIDRLGLTGRHRGSRRRRERARQHPRSIRRCGRDAPLRRARPATSSTTRSPAAAPARGEHGIGQGKIGALAAGARRPDRTHAGHQAGVRSARDHEPRQGAAAKVCLALRRGAVSSVGRAGDF